MNRNELLRYIQQEYVCDVDYPWERYPDYMVVRRRDNQKWFAGIFAIKSYQVGHDTNEPMNIVNLNANLT